MATGTGKMRDDENKNPSTGMGGIPQSPTYSENKTEKGAEFNTNRSDNWTGNEEKLYSGSGPGKSQTTPPGQVSPMRSQGGRSLGGNAAEDLWQAGQETVNETLGNIGEKARDLSSNFADKARHAASDLSERASHAGDYVTGAVKNNPMQSLLIGFGLGCLVGVIVTGAVRR